MVECAAAGIKPLRLDRFQSHKLYASSLTNRTNNAPVNNSFPDLLLLEGNRLPVLETVLILFK